jgi:hypothetical protein
LAFFLDFHHHIILVKGAPASVEEKLRSEFHYFLCSDAEPRLTLELTAGPLPLTPSLPVEKILETCLIYRMGKRKYVDYFGEALTIIDEDTNMISITSASLERLYELAFLTIHSRAGDFLDEAGFSRVHAMAVSYKNVNAVVMLPSKGGKSTLLTYLLENPDIKIIADDMPLVDRRGRILPFPSKISMTEKPESGELAKLQWNEFMRAHYPPKWTASLSAIPERLETEPEKNPVILINGIRLSHGESMISPVPGWQMIRPLLEHMIIGKGLPQIVEIFLSMGPSDILKLMKHAVLRTWCAIMLVRNSQTFTFYIGNDKSYNAQLLLNLLSEHES